MRRRNYPTRRGELFSLRKKRTAGIRLPAWQKAGSLYRLDPTTFPALKKALKKMGFQRDASTMRRQRRISEFGFAEFLGASFHDAPQSARQRLAALPFDHADTYLCVPEGWDFYL
jgi:hypothetical protein